MALQSGFFNSINHDRQYHAEDISSIFDGIITDGIFKTVGEGFVVKAAEGGSDFQVDLDVSSAVRAKLTISKGRAWFMHTWSLNAEEELVYIDEPEALMDRIDAIVLDVNAEESVRANSFAVIKGVPNVEPEKPTLENSAHHKQFALAYIRVYSKSNTLFVNKITQSMIENAIGTKETPWSSALVETIPADTIMSQWSAQLDEFLIAQKKSNTKFQTDLETSFTEWFDDLKVKLDGDTAAKLTSEVITKQVKYIARTIEIQNGSADWHEEMVNNIPMYYTDILTIPGVTDSNIVQITPDPESLDEYASCQVRATAQSYSGLIFAAKEKPEKALTVNILIWN